MRGNGEAREHTCKTPKSRAIFLPKRPLEESVADGYETVTEQELVDRLNEDFQDTGILAEAFLEDDKVKISCHPAHSKCLEMLMAARTDTEPVPIV